MTANAGYHAYATGDVLTAAQVQYNLQNQTVMYFATTTARDAALTGAILVEGMVSYTPATGVMYYNGTAWTAVGGSSSPLTTKGDLYTYSTTNARLAVGSNGQTLVANSGGTTGNAWQDPVQQNPVLNSAMQVWQRGTSVSIAASTSVAYSADRWVTTTGANQAITISRQATSDTTNLPNIQYALRFQRNSGQTGTTAMNFGQPFETINSIPFAGKTVTLSFYARAGANYSAASSALGASVTTGTGTDQNWLTSYTGAAYPVGGTATLTTTWQRFSYSGTIAATATELTPYFYFTPVGTAGTNDYYEVTGVQLEVGSVATPFHTFSTTIQGELAACQRYYFRNTATGGACAPMAVSGATSSTTNFIGIVVYPISMRVSPTSAEFSTLQIVDSAAGAYSVTAVAIVFAGQMTAQLDFNCTAATASRAGWVRANNSTSAYFALSAEL